MSMIHSPASPDLPWCKCTIIILVVKW